MLVAGNTQVISPANIGSELECVVPLNLRPVIDELDLLFILYQGTIAPVHVERVAELEEVIAIVLDEERGHAAGKRLIQVQARNAGVGGRAGGKTVWHHMHLIAEKSEAEIGKKV